MSHTLTESGEIEFYDIQWKDGIIEEQIPRAALDLVEGHEHSHKKKKKKKKKGG